MEDKLVLSTLGHTWILDLDGTIVKHNGHKTGGGDTLLPGVKRFLDSIPSKDMIVFITSRTDKYKDATVSFLCKNNVRYNHIIFGAPYGERILINDSKPGGLNTAVCVNVKRDNPCDIHIILDRDL